MTALELTVTLDNLQQQELIFRALASERRLQILEWLKDPRSTRGPR